MKDKDTILLEEKYSKIHENINIFKKKETQEDRWVEKHVEGEPWLDIEPSGKASLNFHRATQKQDPKLYLYIELDDGSTYDQIFNITPDSLNKINEKLDEYDIINIPSNLFNRMLDLYEDMEQSPGWQHRVGGVDPKDLPPHRRISSLRKQKQFEF